MDIIGLLGKGVGSTGLDVDNALYMTSMTGAVKHEEQDKLIFWGIAAEFIGRVALLAVALYAFSGDEPLFTIGGIGFTPPMVAALVAGVFLLWTNGGELYSFLKGTKNDGENVKPQTLMRALGEMTAVNLLLSIDTVVAVADMTDAFLGMVVIFSVSSVIRLLFVRQIAGFMERHPEATIVTSSFLILVGLSLLAQGFKEDFPEAWFGVGIAIAFVVMLGYKHYHDKDTPRPAPKVPTHSR